VVTVALTSGWLLLAVDHGRIAELCVRLVAAGCACAVVGRLVEAGAGEVRVRG
ncbi:MAG: hypothetical protein QOE72_4619, partial [Chloroflexota bacterium]|nr:hypothetical protein [Chloroflexota bacterium]